MTWLRRTTDILHPDRAPEAVGAAGQQDQPKPFQRGHRAVAAEQWLPPWVRSPEIGHHSEGKRCKVIYERIAG